MENCQNCRNYKLKKVKYQSFEDWFRNDFNDSTFENKKLPVLILMCIPIINWLVFVIVISEYYEWRLEKH